MIRPFRNCYINFGIGTVYLVSCFFFIIFQVIAAFRDPGFFNSVFPMLYEVSNQSIIWKAKGSAGAGESLF